MVRLLGSACASRSARTTPRRGIARSAFLVRRGDIARRPSIARLAPPETAAERLPPGDQRKLRASSWPTSTSSSAPTKPSSLWPRNPDTRRRSSWRGIADARDRRARQGAVRRRRAAYYKRVACEIFRQGVPDRAAEAWGAVGWQPRRQAEASLKLYESCRWPDYGHCSSGARNGNPRSQAALLQRRVTLPRSCTTTTLEALRQLRKDDDVATQLKRWRGREGDGARKRYYPARSCWWSWRAAVGDMGAAKVAGLVERPGDALCLREKWIRLGGPRAERRWRPLPRRR